MSTYTLTQLQNFALAAVNETLDSTAAQFDSGSGTIEEATSAALTRYINDGAAELARTCMPYPVGDATATLVQGALSTPLAAVTDSAGAVIWQPLRVALTVAGVSTEMTPTRDEYARIMYPTLLTDAVGTPLYWWLDSGQSIGLAPKPGASMSLAVYGFAVPPPLALGTDTAAWIMEDEARYLYLYAAYQIAKRNTEDDTLAAKIGTLQQDYLAIQVRKAADLAHKSPALYAAYFAGSVVPPAGFGGREPQQAVQQQ